MIKRFLAIFIFAFCFSAVAFSEEATITLDKNVKTDTAPGAVAAPVANYKEVSALALVDSPAKYLNKPVKIKAKFDKFSAIGLDYPPVNRDAKTYIGFLIKRENVTTYNIPLSELKLIVKRDYAEKEMINVEQDDDIIIFGTVFSTALGDPWVSVDKVSDLTVHKDKENKEADKK